ncbi:uncharacterized protein BJ171DRAFT_78216 [Polychytrium aggregatum]|uniref:uncharacterized protein n=1 Tax=Polychytrium aggregatum TaxID=110093 RepID=UPI0022FE6973|nr:uncharacterized protein BJ171DRAFT_78216 [Polychytrium aggregatum]KAI9190619.1 hypothetical protein BJ171DRAFT_78216 [Polychytrium aggregatum]
MKMLFGSQNLMITANLGFAQWDTSTPSTDGQLNANTYSIVNVIPLPNGMQVVTAQPFVLQRGDYVVLNGVWTRPPLYTLQNPNGQFQVTEQGIRIYSAGGNLVSIQTIIDHSFTVGQTVYIYNSDCVPSLDTNTGNHNGYVVVAVPANDIVTIDIKQPLQQPGTTCSFQYNTNFTLYDITPSLGFGYYDLNNSSFDVAQLIDPTTLLFQTNTGFSEYSSTTTLVASQFRISSMTLGWKTTVSNIPDSYPLSFMGNPVPAAFTKPHAAIHLAGEFYCFLCSPQIGQMRTTRNIKDILAKIQLTENPGVVIFNSFVSTPLIPDTPIARIDYFDFYMYAPTGYLLNFNGLDYSFTIKITETIETSAELPPLNA